MLLEGFLMENNKIGGSVTEPSTSRVKNTDNFEVGIREDNIKTLRRVK